MLLQGRQVARDEKQRALSVIGVEDINKKLDSEVNRALDPVDNELSDLRATLDGQLQRNSQLKVITGHSRHQSPIETSNTYYVLWNVNLPNAVAFNTQLSKYLTVTVMTLK